MTPQHPRATRSTPAPAILLALGLVLAGLAGGCDREPVVPPQEMVRKAEALQREGRHQDSIAPLQAVLMADPTHVRARTLLAVAYLELEDGAAARSHLLRAIRAGADAAALKPLRLRALVQQQAYQRAVDLVTAEDLVAADTPLLHLLAEARVGLNQPEEARALFERILVTGDVDHTARKGLFEIAIASCDYDAAETHLDHLPPEAQSTWRMEGRLALARGEPGRANEAFQRLLAVAPRDQEAVLGLAQATLARGDLDAAEGILLEMVETDPDLTDAHYLLAVTEYLSGNLERALHEVRDVLSAAPQYGPALRLFGLLNLELGRPEQAVESLKGYLAGTPGDLDARKLLVAVLLQLNHPWEAEAQLERVGAVTGDPALDALRGMTHLQLGNYVASIEMLRAATAGLRTARGAAPGAAGGDPVAARVANDSAVEGTERIARLLAGLEADEAAGDASAVAAIIDQGDDAGYGLLAERAAARGDVVEACALYARAMEGDSSARVREAFQALECEARYGGAAMLSELTPAQMQPFPATAPGSRGGDFETQVARLLGRLEGGLETASSDGGGGSPEAAPPGAQMTRLARGLAENLAAEQLNMAAGSGSGPVGAAHPLHLLPPELKQQLKDMRDRLPEWLRALNDRPEDAPESERTALAEASPTRPTTLEPADPPAPPPVFKGLLGVYGGLVDGLARTGDMVREHEGLIYLLAIPVLVGVALLNLRSTRGSRASTTVPAPVRRESSATTTGRRTSSKTRSGSRRHHRSRRRRRRPEEHR